MPHPALGLLLLGLSPVPAPGAAVPTQAAASPTAPGSDEPLAVRAARVWVTPERVLENATVLMRGGRIVEVGTDVAVPEGARVVQGQVACAGFVDSWSVFGLDPDAATDDRTNVATRTTDGIDPYLDARLKRELLRSGITALRLQAGTNARLGGLGAFVRNDPALEPEDALLLGECCVSVSIGLTRGGRTPDVFDRLSELDRLIGELNDAASYLQDRTEYRYELEEWQKKIADKEKELKDGFKKAQKDREKEEKEAKDKGKEFKDKKYTEDKRPKPPRFDPEKEVLARVVSGEIPLVVEAHRNQELRGLLDATKDMTALRLVLAGATEASSVKGELAERGIPVIVWPAPHGELLSNGQPRPGEFREADPSLAAELEAAGVTVLLGSGGAFPSGTRDLPLMASIAAGFGLSRASALAALTTRPARALDVADKIGTLERGMLADVLVLDGEPLDSTSHVQFVILGGKVAVERKE